MTEKSRLTAKNSGRILYLNHDNPDPSGGVKVIYEHVAHLLRNGYCAAVVHLRQGFKPAWFEGNVPVLYCDANLNLQPDDLIILPEDHAGFFEIFHAAPVRKVVFCQNHFYLFQGLANADSWESFGISGVMACSDVVADFIRTHLGIMDVQTVHCATPTLCAPSPRKKLQIAYMPRKRQMEAQFIKSLCTRMLGSEFPVEWVALDGIPQTVVGQTLAESALFLSLSRLDGFGLAPLEAMASGCLVVGFTGFGGLEYATKENGFWCGEDDLVTCACTLATAVRLVREQHPLVEQTVAAALQTAAAYSSLRQEQELLYAIDYFGGEREN